MTSRPSSTTLLPCGLLLMTACEVPPPESDEVGSVLTFFGLPITRAPEDLVAREMEVAFLGGPVDMGLGYHGAGEGPTALRAMRRGVGSPETMAV